MKTRFVAAVTVGLAVWMVTTDRVLQIIGEAATAISNGIERHKM